MTVINSNIKSLIAQQALAVNSRGLSKAMEQLSTGKRINSAGDDAAGIGADSYVGNVQCGGGRVIAKAVAAISG